MATGLLPSRFWTNDDLARLRRLLGWQAAEHDGRMRCGSIPLTDLQPDKFVFFTSYALAGLAFSMSSFLFMLLEYYDLQFQYLSPHSLMLVAIFVHFCEMFICVRPSVGLFRIFHMLRSSRMSPTHLSTYYFQLRSKGQVTYIVSLTPSKWEQWREDWVIVRAYVYDWLVLPSGALMGKRGDWGRVPTL
jgi:hypothetical protein